MKEIKEHVDLINDNIEEFDKAKKLIEIGAKWQQEKLCSWEVIQRIRASKSDAEARRIIRTI